jgi:hypothetical protein
MSDEPVVSGGQPSEHRAGAWVVLIVGVLGLGLGLYHWRSSITRSFVYEGPKYKSPEEIELERIEGLKTKDTDVDGLNDFEESYVFKTSPYLSDSDSDGLPDRDELTAGKDPNCPEGKSCGPLAGAEAQASATAAAPLDGSADLAIQKILNPTAAEIRQMLIQSGMKAEDLAAISDDQLMELYAQSLVEAQAAVSQGQQAAANGSP